LKKIYNYLHGYKKIFALAILSIVVATLMQLSTPILIKYAVDSIIGTEPAGNLQFLMDRFGKSIMSVVWLILASGIIRGIFLFLKGYLSNYAAESIAEDMRNKLYRHTQYLPFDAHSKLDTGDLLQRCTSDIETVRKFLGIQIVDLGRIIFMVIFSIAIMLSLNVKLTLYAIIMIPVLFLFSYFFFLNIQKKFLKSDEAEAALTTVLQENLSGMRVVRAFGREAQEIDKFETVNEKHRKVTYGLVGTLAGFWSATDFLTLIQNAIVLLVGTFMVIDQEITLGTLIAFVTYESMLLLPVKQLGRLLSELGKTTVSIERIEEVFEMPLEKNPDNALKPNLVGDIKFENVSFAYPDGKLALDNVSFTLRAGQTMGILGSTGSGKSSLVHLLQGLYDYSGKIFIDGIDIQTMDKQWLRKNVGLILQEPYLYSKTIKENIGITDSQYTEDTIVKAAKIASIHENIKGFKYGYDTIVGEKGVSLSGGQKQRIAISRTVIDLDKPILIFDDSLSALDTETDMKIRSALKENNKKWTTIIISHRITSLAEADWIVVLDEGKVIQIGTHDSLSHEKGVYKRIWDLQKLVI